MRARTHDGYTTYFHTTKTPTEDASGRVEHESVISAETTNGLDDYRRFRHVVRNVYAEHFEPERMGSWWTVYLACGTVCTRNSRSLQSF